MIELALLANDENSLTRVNALTCNNTIDQEVPACFPDL